MPCREKVSRRFVFKYCVLLESFQIFESSFCFASVLLQRFRYCESVHSIMKWPDNRAFAFSVFDDPDSQTTAGLQTVYGFLSDAGLRTTIGVWPRPPIRERNSPGQTCGDPKYRKCVEHLASRGFEIGYHNTSPHSSFRNEIVDGLDAFSDMFGKSPITMANHYNAEAIYWGKDRLGGVVKTVYSTVTAGRNLRFYGHVEGSPHFWGDLCKSRVRYCRNFTYDDINTLQACPWMPYYDPERPYVQYWFASSNAKNVEGFVKLVSEENQDRLEAEGGACIVYTHFGLGYVRDGALDRRVRMLIDRLKKKNGWFVPLRTLLDYLMAQRSDATITSAQRRKLEWRWLRARLLHGSS
jgi:hypothetical protein